jgi:hypothetical protein
MTLVAYAGHDVMVAAPHSAASTITSAGFVARGVGDIPPEGFGAVIAGTTGMSLRDGNLYFVREV